MPKYQYTAVNNNGKSLTGVIDAESESSARTKLNSLRLSVLSIIALNENSKDLQEDFIKFKFEATDKEGKKVIGTISAITLIDAYKRLVLEYQLKVFKISSIKATQSEFDQSMQKINELDNLLNKLENTIKTDNSAIEYEDKIKHEEFHLLIDEVIQALRSIKTNFTEDLKPDALEFIQKYEIHLERIKHSENIDNVLQAALKVLKHLQESQLFLSENKHVEEKVEMQMNLLRLSNILKVKEKNANTVNQNLKSTLSKFGIKTKQRLEPNSHEPTFTAKINSYLTIIFKTKSKQIRLEAFKDLFNEIINHFKENKRKSTFVNSQEKLSLIEQELLKVSYVLIIVYFSYYFIATFISEKILNRSISSLLFLFNTKILIYSVIASLFLHGSIKLRELMLKHKISHGKIVYSLLSLLFAVIVINL